MQLDLYQERASRAEEENERLKVPQWSINFTTYTFLKFRGHCFLPWIFKLFPRQRIDRQQSFFDQFLKTKSERQNIYYFQEALRESRASQEEHEHKCVEYEDRFTGMEREYKIVSERLERFKSEKEAIQAKSDENEVMVEFPIILIKNENLSMEVFNRSILCIINSIDSTSCRP